MGRLTLAATDGAVKGLVEGDREQLSDVIDEDDVIDNLERSIDQIGMDLLLRYTPVASDLRMVLSSINVGRSLERIADHAVNIAKRGRKLIKQGTVDEVAQVEACYLDVRKIVSGVLEAYADVEDGCATDLIQVDKKIDQSHKQLSKSLTKRISSHPEAARPLIELLFISRSFERIGDLAVNIAEDVIFMAPTAEA